VEQLLQGANTAGRGADADDNRLGIVEVGKLLAFLVPVVCHRSLDFLAQPGATLTHIAPCVCKEILRWTYFRNDRFRQGFLPGPAWSIAWPIGIFWRLGPPPVVSTPCVSSPANSRRTFPLPSWSSSTCPANTSRRSMPS